MDLTLMLSESRAIGGQTFPAMPMSGMDPNYFTINGKAFPAVVSRPTRRTMARNRMGS